MLLQATSGAFAGTVAFAFSAGVATFLAPCAFPLLPGYVGYYVSREDADRSGAVARGLTAALGALLVLSLVLGLLYTVGQSLVSRLTLFEPVVGVALVLVGGLYLLGRAPQLHLSLPRRRASVWGFGLFGGVYALAAAGCVVPVFAGVVTQSLTLPAGEGVVALFVYAASVAVPLALVTLLSAVGSTAVRGLSGYVGSVQRVAGGIMLVAGLWQVVASLRFLGYL